MPGDDIDEVGESDKAFRNEPLTTLAERAAEMAYRRGYQQGFYRAWAYMEHGATVQEIADYEQERIVPWRRGQKERYVHAEPPPDDIFR
jgi:hypothetical protein